MIKGIRLLLWLSPFLRLGIFFPLGAWMAFFRDKSIRLTSFTLIAIQSFVFGVFYILELTYYLNWDLEENFLAMIQSDPTPTLASVYLAGLIFLIANSFYIRYVFGKKTALNPNRKTHKMMNIFRSLTVWFLALLFSLLILYIQEEILGQNASQMAPLVMERNLSLSFFLSLAIVYSWFNKGESFYLFRTPYSRFVWSGFRRRYFLRGLIDGRIPDSNLLHKMSRSAFFRDNFFPGWGHIYVGDFWKGFPLLFVFLLSIFLFATAFFAWDSPLLGIQFLGSWGLKPGIPDKEFFYKASNITYMVGFLVLALFTYVYSKYLLRRIFLNLRMTDNPEKQGLRAGFMGFFPISLLVHLILIVILFIIPFSLQRKKSDPNKNDQANHFQPDKMEFYFIDPNLPDDVKDLNGGVITGTDTPNQEEGEKVSDEKTGDMGPKSGFVKKIKGKKVPATYSNYISAKMRGPENYLDYWKRAPQPYSSVVAYTITPDGYVEDVELIEGSSHPDQDLLTLELIESLGPLMPPPTDGKRIRVTELFWNGSLDPEAMPTPLQSEMVTHFDGRYMEEVD